MVLCIVLLLMYWVVIGEWWVVVVTLLVGDMTGLACGGRYANPIALGVETILHYSLLLFIVIILLSNFDKWQYSLMMMINYVS